MARIIFSLGSNLGERDFLMKQAVFLLKNSVGKIVKKSSIYESEPWGAVDSDQWFLNSVVICETFLEPKEVLKCTQEIEKKLGRQKTKSKIYAARPIDIDILLYDDLVIKTPRLKIPHPHMSERRFVLVPLCEIAPRFRHPCLKKTMKQLLKDCVDNSIVRMHKI